MSLAEGIDGAEASTRGRAPRGAPTEDDAIEDALFSTEYFGSGAESAEGRLDRLRARACAVADAVFRARLARRGRCDPCCVQAAHFAELVTQWRESGVVGTLSQRDIEERVLTLAPR